MKFLSQFSATFIILTSICFNISASELKSHTPFSVPLWQERQPVFDNSLPEDAEKIENADWITQITTPEIYIYPAPNPSGKALLMCPGGAYWGLAIEHEGKEMAPILNENGITLAVLKYRMPNGHCEVPAEDVYRAFEILLSKSEELGINPNLIGIGGASAGGHLASTIATHLSSCEVKPAFQVLLYPVISMRAGITHEGSRNNLLGENPSEEQIKRYSNELNVTAATPKAFIVVSEDDDLVPVENTLLYFEAMRKNGISVALHIYPSGGHGWGMHDDFPYKAQWLDELIAWLNQL